MRPHSGQCPIRRKCEWVPSHSEMCRSAIGVSALAVFPLASKLCSAGVGSNRSGRRRRGAEMGAVAATESEEEG